MHNYHTTGDHSHHGIIDQHTWRAHTHDVPATAIYMAESEHQAIWLYGRGNHAHNGPSDSTLYT